MMVLAWWIRKLFLCVHETLLCWSPMGIVKKSVLVVSTGMRLITTNQEPVMLKSNEINSLAKALIYLTLLKKKM